MKKEKQIALLAVITILAFVALIGMYLFDSARMNFYINSPSNSSAESTLSEMNSAESSEPSKQIEPININAARDIDFIALPGIGEVLAERIVAYRDEYGAFESIDDLLNVDGIYQSKLDSIREYIILE